MAKIGNETRLILKLAEARADKYKKRRITEINSNCADDANLIANFQAGMNEMHNAYRDVLAGIVCDLEDNK
jgi:hypothetical protein